MKSFALAGIVALFFLAGCEPAFTSFEECVAAGNPVMESYPRQCRADGQTFVEKMDETTKNTEFYECTEQEKQTEACTREYNPVCAILDNSIRCITEPCASTDALTMSNDCVACSQDAIGYYQGACEEQTFVVCQETFTGFDAVEHANNIGGICVDVCPGNYDGFITQIGVELCIQHYGVEEIEQWSLCHRSSDTCECVKAYETTSGEEIEDAEYRCVPDKYSERLLFRGGVDRLDEKGRQSVMIA